MSLNPREKMKRTLSSFNLRSDYRSELDSQRRKNFSYCSKFGIPCRAKRFIKTFSGQAAFPSYFHHAFGLCYVKDGRFNQGAVTGIFFKAGLKVQGAVLFAFKKINCVIRFAKFCIQHIWEGKRFFSPNTFARTVIKICVNNALKSILKLHKGEAFINQPATDIKNFARKSAVRTNFHGTFISFVTKLLVAHKKSSSLEPNFNQSGLRVRLIIGFILATLSLSSQADDFGDLAKRCAPEVSEDTLRALVRTESSFNPYAIGIVGGGSRQPKAFHEAMAIIAQLELEGKNYSVGLAQINKKNFSKLGINAAGALDACTNLKAASKILSDCYQRAQKNSGSNSLHDALSCYYSGNFQTGYRHGYVDKVRANAGINVIQTVPSIREAETQQKESSTLVAKGDKPSTGLIF